ncbi:MAG: tRNA (N6-isopentenyl adenosine(37)-C2)-methylthiotransferase MiaB [Parcubacteria group bacterium]
MQKYFIKTFGCAMNHSDSERIAAFLEKHGFSPASDITKADLAVFNTCGVRQMAEDRAYGQTHNLKKSNPKIKIVLTGCLANRKDVQRRLKNKVDLFFPIDKFELFENFVIGSCLEIRNSKFEILAHDKCTNQESIPYLSIEPKYSNNFQASVPIMTGCNNFCSYCVVPYARGREASRPAEEIIAEIKKLVESGYKEITLLGQNVNSYSDSGAAMDADRGEIPLKGFHPYKTINFPKLLKKINAIPGKFWIRFTSNHPKDVTDEMIGTVTKCKKVCESFHLPVQAGNDEILKKMNRKYTAKDYLALVKKIKTAFKKNKSGIPFSITSDLIVGFPGETKKQFLDSAEIMGKVGYDMVFFGQFSPRPGTTAWEMKDNVSKIEKERRERFLNEILKKTALANSKKFLNTDAEVLIENEKDGIYFGKTRTAKNVKVISNKKNLVGKFVKVKITRVNIWNLEGKS